MHQNARLGLLHDRVAERIDTLIGGLWAVGMAVGILLIKFTPGYHTELMSYLFGNIVYVSRGEVLMMAGLDAVILVTVVIFHKRLLAICLDEQQARLQGFFESLFSESLSWSPCFLPSPCFLSP